MLGILACRRSFSFSSISLLRQVRRTVHDNSKRGPLQNKGQSSDEKPDADLKIEALKQIEGFSEVDVKSGAHSSLISYLAASNTGFKKSVSNINALKRQKNPTVSDVFEYLVRECQLEATRIKNSGVEQVLKHLETSNKREDFSQFAVPSQEENLNSLVDTIVQEAVYSDVKAKLHPLANTELFIDLLERILNDKSVSDKSTIISLDQMVEAFENSKLIPDKDLRLKGQYLSGKLIYALKRVRLDPGNESFYIDALLRFKKFKTAAALFETYKARVNERWWYEVGMMVYLRGNKLLKFNNVYEESASLFGSEYVRPDVLKLAIKRHLYARNLTRARQLTNRLLSMVKIYGWNEEVDGAADVQTANRDERIFESSEDANDFLNEIQKVSRGDYLNVVSFYLKYGFKKEAMQLFAQFEEYTKMDQRLFDEVIVKFRLQWLKEFDLFSNELRPYLTTEKAAQKLEQFKNWYEESLQQSGFSEVRQNFEFLLFPNIRQLVEFKNVSTTLQPYLMDFISRGHANDDEAVEFRSKKLQAMMKLLLIADREEAALNILSQMEEPEASKRSCGSLYPAVNSHHYILFINFYRMKAIRRASSAKNYAAKVDAMLQRAKDHKMQHDPLFISCELNVLLQRRHWLPCLKLVNELLSVKTMGEHVPFSDFLYLEIWRVYKEYYKLLNRKTETEDLLHATIQARKDIKSGPNYKMLTVFKWMVIDDGILLNPKLIDCVIRAFCANREWNNLIGVLSFISEEQLLEIDDSIIEYIRNGVKNEYAHQLRLKIARRNEQGIEIQDHLIQKWMNQLKEIETQSKFCNLKSAGVSNTDNYQTLLLELMDYLDLINYNKENLLSQLEEVGQEAILDRLS